MQQTNPYAPTAASLTEPSEQVPAEQGRATLEYAGFWRRFLAYWIDFAFFIPVMLLAYYAGEKSKLFNLYWFAPGLALGLFFHVYLVQAYGGTPGKLIMKTRIAMVDGAPVTARAATVRYSVLFVLSALQTLGIVLGTLAMSDEHYFSLSYLARAQRTVELAPAWYSAVAIFVQVWVWGEFVSMLFNKKRRAIHDFMAGTIVIRSTHVA